MESNAEGISQLLKSYFGKKILAHNRWLTRMNNLASGRSGYSAFLASFGVKTVLEITNHQRCKRAGKAFGLTECTEAVWGESPPSQRCLDFDWLWQKPASVTLLFADFPALEAENDKRRWECV